MGTCGKQARQLHLDGEPNKEPPKRGLKVITRVRERGVGEARTQMSRSQVSFLLKVWSINQQRQYHLES